MGFIGESFVDIGADKGLAFLEDRNELADAEFVLAAADEFFDVFFRRHGCLVNRMNEEMLDTSKKDGACYYRKKGIVWTSEMIRTMS